MIDRHGIRGYTRTAPEEIDGAWGRYTDRVGAGNGLDQAEWLEAYGRIRSNNGRGNAFELQALTRYVGETRVRKNLFVNDSGVQFIPDHSEVTGGVLRFVEVKDVSGNPLGPSSNLGAMAEFLEDHALAGGTAELYMALSDRTQLSPGLRDMLDSAEAEGVIIEYFD